ncbi:histidine kinase [candidate division KSB1 bacterium 4572_119]|nr:MAG: histidine kinase [candidate division KSB1 bacterium 4572_119]
MKKNHKTILVDRVKKYHFELKHLLILLLILLTFQVFVSVIQKYSMRNFLVDTQKWYQQDFAERIAILTATSLEMLLETSAQNQNHNDIEVKKIVQAFNIILSQQLLQHHVEEVCVILSAKGGDITATDKGQALFSYFFDHSTGQQESDIYYDHAVKMYKTIMKDMEASEQIYSTLEGRQAVHVFVPFVPKGEYAGAVYMKSKPEFSFLTGGILTGYNEISLISTGLILFGLLAMFYISTYAMRERNEAQEQLYQEREKKLKENIHLQKEALFAKRIYHTHHKAEKIMGFIKEDLSALAIKNIDSIKYRVIKYANFISRVIYDMKWFDPPIHAIRNPIFKTDLNELIKFIIDNIFLRVSKNRDQFEFNLDLDRQLPKLGINEFVIWEIIEPLIQNSIDHSDDEKIVISIRTQYDKKKNVTRVFVEDDGKGIAPELLEKNDLGVKKIFLENISTKNQNQRSGYGCYIAYEIATERCGWQIDAVNKTNNGCQMILTIPHFA